VRMGWRAGSLALLMPLSATLGILAVPDVPMAIAALLCLDAGARLLRGVGAGSALLLACGLLIGALSHYRFIGVIVVGFIALVLLPEGRKALRDPRVWIALSVGLAAWVPLMAWNLDNQDAGLKFQVIERHPWAFQPEGLLFLVIQPLLVTPLLFAAMAVVAGRGLRNVQGGFHHLQWRYFALVGATSTLLIFALGFLAAAGLSGLAGLCTCAAHALVASLEARLVGAHRAGPVAGDELLPGCRITWLA
jgi:4-amino-4-deoxy-L-arabinose transferase-like glycosyltransferase